MNPELIIELRDVTVPSRRDAELAIIEKINWSVRAGEFWVVGGQQGTGKSDLTFMLAGLTKPLSGSYVLYGQDMGSHFGDEFLPNRLRVGMVFDDARLFGSLTVAGNVALPIQYHHSASEEDVSSWVSALLQAFELSDIAEEKPAALSRTWRRRAALARALVLRPEVLILENPVRGLDARHAVWWMDFVSKLWRGKTLISEKPMTIIASTDEFWPWRNSGAQFAIISREGLATVGTTAPQDEHQLAF
jgi:ABC-type transporter Mla maintaining outer membrane lipid asymmetry ATPase subunit MlaF